MIASLPIRRPRGTLAVAFALTLLSVALAFRLRPETSIEGLLDPTEPAVAAMGQVMRRFPIVDELLVLATLPEGRGEGAQLVAFAGRFEANLRDARDAHGEPLVQAVRHRPEADAVTFVQRVVVPNGLYYLDDPSYAEAMRRLTRAGIDEQLARDRALLAVPGPAAAGLGKVLLKDPLRLLELLKARLGRLSPGGMNAAAGSDGAPGPFFSSDGRSLLIRVSGTESTRDLNYCRAIVEAVGRATKDANVDGLTVRVAGGYAVAAFSADRIRHEAIVGVNGSVVGLLLLFAILYRRPLRLFTIAFVPMAMGIAWGLGAFALVHPTFTPLAAVIGGALAGIGIDYFIFFLTQHARRGDASVESTLRSLRSALLAAWFTSAVGFVAVAWSPVRVLRDFALLGTLALAGAYLAAITVLPAALTLISSGTGISACVRRSVSAVERLRAAYRPTQAGMPVPPALAPPIAFTRPLGRLVTTRARGTLGVAGVLTLAAVAYVIVAGRSASPSSSLLLLHPQPNPPVEAQRAISRTMGIAPGQVQLYLRAATPDALLRLAHDVDRRLREPTLDAAGRTGVFSLASVLPDPDAAASRRAAIDPTLADRVTRDLPIAAEAAGFNRGAFAAYANVLRVLVAPGAPPTIPTLVDYPSVARLVLARDALGGAAATDALCTIFFDNALDERGPRDAAIDAIGAALRGVDGVTVTGMAPINRQLERSIRRDLPMLVAIAVACIALVHAAHFRSVGLALLSLVPTGVSALAVLVFMHACDQPLNVVNMVMVPLLLGIDTDYGILTVTAWTHARTRRALADAFPAAASGVITCALATIVGFGSLAFVGIPAIASLGWLIIVGIAACLAGTIFVVWPTMYLLSPRGDE